MPIVLFKLYKVQDAYLEHPVPCFDSGKCTRTRSYDFFHLPMGKDVVLSF